MKQRSLGMNLLMAVLTIAVVAYFGLQAFLYFRDPLTTAVTYTYTVEEAKELNGCMVRRELVLPEDAGGLLQLQRNEGERVGAGGTVAAVYTDQNSLDQQNELNTLNLRIEQLRFAQDAALGAEASLKLDAQIYRNLRTLNSAVQGGRLDLAETSANQLKALVLKRDYTYSDAGDLDAEIATLVQQRDALKSRTANSTRRITAPKAGLYSAVVDGWENTLTPDKLAELTPSALAALQPDPNLRSNVGKLVLGEEWFYVAPMKTEEAKALSEKRGLVLRFTKGVERDLPVELLSIGPEENGRSVVVFRGNQYLPELTILRQQSARVVSQDVSGLRVPKEALRAASRMLDRETGEEIVGEQSGVYCVVGREAMFKPVEVLWNGDGFLLVRSTAEKETVRLRPGDQVIVSARGLYDGKVVEN